MSLQLTALGIGALSKCPVGGKKGKDALTVEELPALPIS